MSSSPVDIGDYKPCTMTPDEFGAALAIVVSARFRKQVCDLYKDDNAERKEFFEAQIQRISNNYKVHRANNAVLKKKIEDNAMLKKAFQEAMPNILASATAFHAQHTASAPAGGSNSMMTIDEIFAVIKAGGSNADIEKVVGSGFHHLESQSQFLFGAAFMDVNEENQKICAENLVIQSLLDQSSSSSSTIDIGDYKPVKVTPDEFRDILATAAPAHLHKHLCDHNKDATPENKRVFESHLGTISKNVKALRAENVELKKKLEENAELKRRYEQIMPLIAHTTQAIETRVIAIYNGTDEQKKKAYAYDPNFYRFEATSQFSFGTAWKVMNEEMLKLGAENEMIKRLARTCEEEQK